MITLLRRGLWVFAFFSSLFAANGQTTYVWVGGSSGSWTVPTNWSPARVTPLATDDIQFDDGNTIVVTNVPTQTIARLFVQFETIVSLQASSNRTLTISNLIQVDEECELRFSNNGGAMIDVYVASGSTANIFGKIHMDLGTFRMQGSTMVLSGASPLNKPIPPTPGGQFALNESCHLLFSAGDNPSGATKLTNNIFLGPPTIYRITMNNPAGAELGDQSITVKDQIILADGTLKTNSAGRIKLAITAAIPTETFSSRIEGYLEMIKNVGTGAATFVGLEMGAGADDIGVVSVVRRTGSAGVISFNGISGIASTWSISSLTLAQPISGRSLKFSWVEGNDNGNDPLLRFQVYSYDGGPSWEGVGSLMLLESNSDTRKTQAVTTTHFSEWTVADESHPLPVTWVDFYGKKKDNSIVLTWKTGTEENTDFFDVEKMRPDKTFFQIGQHQAAGNSHSIKSYSFEDGEPSYGLNYYRIKQVDIDDKFSYSKIIAVYYDEGVIPYRIYPIPSDSRLTIERSHRSMGGETVTLLDQFGREVYAKHWLEEEPITVENLPVPAGLYRLVIVGNGTRYTQRVIIQ